jgi:AcrR family transcriptional regulator
MIEAHRHRVREAILDATAALVTEHGLSAVTMGRIAEKAGLARATLDRHFPDVDAIMREWHHRQVSTHLAYLADIRDQPGDPVQRLDAVLRAYAVIGHQTHAHRTTAPGVSLHGDEQVLHAQRHLHDTIRDLLAEGAATGDIRDDVAPEVLASHCLHAMSAAGSLLSAAAVRRLVADTLAGLRHP